MITFNDFLELQESFKDLGKLSDDDLKKGQRLTGDDDFIEVTARVFKQSIEKIKVNDLAKGDNAKGLDTLTVYDLREYNKMNCYLGKNNSSGYCIKKGELVSVFSSQGSSGSSLMKSAVANGANRLDCFAIRSKTGKISGGLYSLYSKFGFKIDTNMNEGTPGEPYAIVNGISDFVDDAENVHPDAPEVVIFMKR